MTRSPCASLLSATFLLANKLLANITGPSAFHRPMRLPLLLFCSFLLSDASYCGENGVPFSLEVLPNGSPVLGCAQPSCVAQPADDVDDSSFQVDGAGQADGFFRRGDRTSHGFLQTNKLRANCSEDYNQLACTRKNQWVGGIDFIDHPRQPLLLRCCTFEGLRFSQDVGVTTIGMGEAITGGEVIRDNRQISFDVIANVRKVVDEEDSRIISYEVTVRRMNCLPDPPEIEVPTDDDVGSEVLKILEKSSGSAPVNTPVPNPEPPQEQKPLQRRKLKKHNIYKKKNNEEQFHGSFGAPIYTPEARPRHIPPPRRVLPTTEAPLPPTTPPPAPTLPTLPPFMLFPFHQPPRLPQAFGVSQANMNPLPPPTHHLQLPVFQQTVAPYNPFALPHIGMATQTRYGETQPYNPFAFHQTLQMTPMQLPTMFPPFGIQQQPQQALPASHNYQQVETSGLAQPLRKTLPGLDERPDVIEPQMPPTQQQLGSLFQPPSFNALDNALQNFRLQG